MTTNGFVAKKRQRHEALLILGRDVFGASAEAEEDFLAWCTFAAARIDDTAQLRVLVHVRDVEDVCQLNRIVAAGYAEDWALEDAVQRLWRDWLRLSSGAICLDSSELEDDTDDFYTRPTLRRTPAAKEYH